MKKYIYSTNSMTTILFLISLCQYPRYFHGLYITTLKQQNQGFLKVLKKNFAYFFIYGFIFYFFVHIKPSVFPLLKLIPNQMFPIKKTQTQPYTPEDFECYL